MLDKKTMKNGNRSLPTKFAPAERSDTGELGKLVKAVDGSKLIQALLDSVDGYLLILNNHRQIVAVNDHAQGDSRLGRPEGGNVYGGGEGSCRSAGYGFAEDRRTG